MQQHNSRSRLRRRQRLIPRLIPRQESWQRRWLVRGRRQRLGVLERRVNGVYFQNSRLRRELQRLNNLVRYRDCMTLGQINYLVGRNNYLRNQLSIADAQRRHLQNEVQYLRYLMQNINMFNGPQIQLQIQNVPQNPQGQNVNPNGATDQLRNNNNMTNNNNSNRFQHQQNQQQQI